MFIVLHIFLYIMKILTACAGVYSAAFGVSMMNDYETPDDNYGTRIQGTKNKLDPKYKFELRVKHTRTYIIPEDSIRCTAITKKGERCACRRLQESDYCVRHNKKNNPKPITKIVQEKINEPIRRTLKNLYGLLK